MNIAKDDIRNHVLITEKGDGDEELLWPKSELKYIDTYKDNNKVFDILVGQSGPLNEITIALEIGDGYSLLDIFEYQPITGGRVYLCESEGLTCSVRRHIGKTGVYIEKFYDPVFGISETFDEKS